MKVTSTWVNIYEDRFLHWFLKHARMVQNEPEGHGGFVVLLIALGFIEGYEMYRTGEDSRRRSERFFTEGFKRIVGNTTHLDDDQKGAAMRRKKGHRKSSGGVNTDALRAPVSYVFPFTRPSYPIGMRPMAKVIERIRTLTGGKK